MSKFKVTTREIGAVSVFDLRGEPCLNDVQDVAWKIQRSIRRHRLQRIILNFQMIHSLDTVGLRKLLAVCLRPKNSVIYGANQDLMSSLEDGHVPSNVEICSDEKEVAECLGPFLFDKEPAKKIPAKTSGQGRTTIGQGIDKRRSHRMHVAIPIELKIFPSVGEPIVTKAIATNISEGGMFAEYLDLEAVASIDKLEPIKDCKVEISIFPSANFPEEYHLDGKISRKGVRKKQLGLAVEFIGS